LFSALARSPTGASIPDTQYALDQIADLAAFRATENLGTSSEPPQGGPGCHRSAADYRCRILWTSCAFREAHEGAE